MNKEEKEYTTFIFFSSAPFLYFFPFYPSILAPEMVKLLCWGFSLPKGCSWEGFRQNIRVLLEVAGFHHVESLQLNLSLCALCLMCLRCRECPRVSRWMHEMTTIKWDPTEKVEAERIEIGPWEGAQPDLPIRIEEQRLGFMMSQPRDESSWCRDPLS